MIFTLGKQRILTKTERNYIMRNICVRDAPCWDSNVLNASSTHYNCRLPEQNDEMPIQTWHWNPNENLSIINFRADHAIKTSTQRPYIHSPAPKCFCKQGTTNINIIIKEQKMFSTQTRFCNCGTPSTFLYFEDKIVTFCNRFVLHIEGGSTELCEGTNRVRCED